MTLKKIFYLSVLFGFVLCSSNHLISVTVAAHADSTLSPLSIEERDLEQRLEAHVRAVASVPHNVMHYDELKKSAAYIEHRLQEFGYKVRRQKFAVEGRVVKNIEAVLEPMNGAQGNVQTLVIGAHYDSFFFVAGANDNGTGVAATLELSRLLKGLKPKTTRIRFVLFVNEEPPYFHTKDMGSWRYAKMLKERGEDVLGMISLETIGAFYDEPGSQRYPKALGEAFPDKTFPSVGNFVGFVGLPGSREFLDNIFGAFRRATKFPALAEVAPAHVTGFGMSDHWAFYKFGFPAIMITDTAVFRYKHYHLKSDTPDKVQYDQLARITNAVKAALQDIIQ